MSKKFLLPLIFLCISAAGCNKNPDPKPSKLTAPVLQVNAEKTGLTWNKIDGAVKYDIKINEEAAYEAKSYEFCTLVGSYSVRVRAVASTDENTSDFSEPFTYITKEASLGEFVINNDTVSWPKLEGNGVQVYQTNKYVDVTGSTFTPPSAGNYKFRAKDGWNDAQKTFFVDNLSNETTLYFCPGAKTPYILEDATAETDADLQELYTVEKYDTDHWAPSAASINLNGTVNKGNTPGKCAEFNYWRHSTFFKYSKEIKLTDSRDTLDFYAKGDDLSTMIIVFQVTKDLTVGDMELKGIFASFTFDLLPSKWQHHTVSLNDPNWKIDYGGSKLSFNDVKNTFVKKGIIVNTLGDLLTFTNEFQIRVKAEHDENWSKTKIWMDEIQLNNSHGETKVEDVTALYDTYTGVVGTSFSEVSIKEDKTISIGEATGTYEREDTTLKIAISSPVTAKIEMKTDDNGDTYKYVKGEGTVSSFENIKFIPKVYLLDSFTNYTETGTGYDLNHTDPTQVSGLRAHYYSDYYTGSGASSPIGGNGWSLMGSTDYLDLAKGEGVGHTDTKAMKLKYNPSNPLRTISGDICSLDNAPEMGRGQIFSFWVKGCTKYDFTMKVRVYYDSAKLTPSTQQMNSTLKEGIVVSQNSDWHEVQIELDANKTYYGFSITTVANWQSSNDYFYVDDFSIYGSVNPWTI